MMFPVLAHHQSKLGADKGLTLKTSVQSLSSQREEYSRFIFS